MKPQLTLKTSFFAFMCLMPSLGHAEMTYSIGAGVIYQPDYVGSDEYEAMPLPLASVAWENDSQIGHGIGIYNAELSVIDGLQIQTYRNGYDSHEVQLSLGVKPEFGRDEDDNDALRGMGDIDPHAIGSLIIEYGPKEKKSKNFITGSVEVDADITGQTDGITASAGIALNHAVGERMLISHGPEVQWANKDYMQAYFGVDSTQAARSAYNQYNPDSGIQGVKYKVSAQYRYSESIGIVMIGQYEKLLGDAADSPLVDQEGNDNQFSIIAGVSYKF